MKAILLITFLAMSLSVNCQKLDTLCVPRSSIEICLLTATDRDNCLNRENQLLEAYNKQADQVASLKMTLQKNDALLQINEELCNSEKNTLNSKLQIEKNRKRRNLWIGAGIGGVVGTIIGVLIAR